MENKETIQAFLYAKLTPYDTWETRPERSYDFKDLQAEYRKLMYTPEAIKMIESFLLLNENNNISSN